MIDSELETLPLRNWVCQPDALHLLGTFVVPT